LPFLRRRRERERLFTIEPQQRDSVLRGWRATPRRCDSRSQVRVHRMELNVAAHTERLGTRRHERSMLLSPVSVELIG
jgi:hypothetical protein